MLDIGKGKSPDVLVLGGGGRAFEPVPTSPQISPRQYEPPPHSEFSFRLVEEETRGWPTLGFYGHTRIGVDPFSEPF